MENWNKFLKEEKIWKKVKVPGRTKNNFHYSVEHIPSGKTLPTSYYKTGSKDVDKLIIFLNDNNWESQDSEEGVNEKDAKDITKKILKAGFGRDSMKYAELDNKEETK